MIKSPKIMIFDDKITKNHDTTRMTISLCQVDVMTQRSPMIFPSTKQTRICHINRFFSMLASQLLHLSQVRWLDFKIRCFSFTNSKSSFFITAPRLSRGYPHEKKNRTPGGCRPKIPKIPKNPKIL